MSKKSIPDKASKKILSYSIADKKVLWLSAHNKYLVVIPPVDEIIQMLYLGNNDLQIIDYCKSNLQFDSEESTQIIAQLTNNLGKELKNQSVQKSTYSFHVENLPQKFTCNHFYKINEIIFFITTERGIN